MLKRMLCQFEPAGTLPCESMENVSISKEVVEPIDTTFFARSDQMRVIVDVELPADSNCLGFGIDVHEMVAVFTDQGEIAFDSEFIDLVEYAGGAVVRMWASHARSNFD